MPTNLNALIRYKQIDACLKNPFVNCTISHMQEVCTQSLGENRGIYKQVSERTIREDIRVLRSDILGFNAPIAFEDGKYFYTDHNYTIFSTPLTEKELLKDVLAMLLKERKNIADEEVDRLLLRISSIIGEVKPKILKPKIIKRKKKTPSKLPDQEDQSIKQVNYLYNVRSDDNKNYIMENNDLDNHSIKVKESKEVFYKSYKTLYWGAVFEFIGV